MYGYVYMTICKVNNKKYIGKHAKPQFDNNYYGSSISLKEEIKMLGKENFVVVVLDWAQDKEELENLEAEWISKSGAVTSEEYYNAYPGVKNQ